jgi:hypothetical protein
MDRDALPPPAPDEKMLGGDGVAGVENVAIEDDARIVHARALRHTGAVIEEAGR